MNHEARRDPLRVGIGGPVGSGKTALMDWLCKRMRGRFEIAAITNDIYTREDAEFLTRSGALPSERILGVETGGCPHTAIREDASINLAAVADMHRLFPRLDLILIESGGDNLAATFSPELADLTIYVIDVAAGDKIPRKGGPGITRSDLLVINKTDLAPLVGASLEVMDRDTRHNLRSRHAGHHDHDVDCKPTNRPPKRGNLRSLFSGRALCAVGNSGAGVDDELHIRLDIEPCRRLLHPLIDD